MAIRKSFVYLILNKVTGVVYVGGTTHLQARRRNHFILLRIGEHDNRNLQAAYNVDGESNFELIVLEQCARKTLKEREQVWMDRFTDKYNIVPNAKGGRLPGVPLTEEWKRKIGEGAMGNKGNVDAPRTAEWRKNLSEAGKRRWAKVRAELT